MAGGGGEAVVSGGTSENFRAKRGTIPKIEKERGSCRHMCWFEGGLRDN